MSTLRREVYAQAGRAAKEAGFAKVPGKQLYAMVLHPGIRGYLEFTDVNRGGMLVISVGVGVVVPEVEELIARWTGGSADGVFTAFGNIGYIRPEPGWVDIRFADGLPVEAGIRLLEGLVTNEAVPFMDEVKSIDNCAELLEKQVFPDLKERLVERLPVIYALAGRDQEAAKHLAYIVDALASGTAEMRAARWSAYVDGFQASFPRIHS